MAPMDNITMNIAETATVEGRLNFLNTNVYIKHQIRKTDY